MLRRGGWIWFAMFLGTTALGLAWLGAGWVRRAGVEARERLQSAARAHLEGARRILDGAVSDYAREGRRLLTDLAGSDTEAWRAAARGHRFVTQVFARDAADRWIHPPPPPTPRTAEESAFLDRTSRLWAEGERFSRPPLDGAPASANDEGWLVWAYGRGTSWLFWRRMNDGRLLGMEWSRAAALADLIGRLPTGGTGGRTVLKDAAGEIVYQWGDFSPPAGAEALAVIELTPPLTGWSLRHYVPADDRALRWAGLGAVLPGLAALMLALVASAVLFLRENRRWLREAEQRVSFVNQVTHELKTPLTNIQLYADLVNEALPEDAGSLRSHLSVILAETQRLGRLIQNVLTFGRQQRGRLMLHHAPLCVDELLRGIADRFAPALAMRGIALELDLAAGGWVQADGDAIEQILVNLIGNAEKYAAGGGWIGVRCRQAGGQTELYVCDRGPGVPSEARERVFEPFTRLDDRTRAGVAGTGIGLSIVRAVARLHGGEARLEAHDPAPGLCVRVTLHTPIVTEPGAVT